MYKSQSGPWATQTNNIINFGSGVFVWVNKTSKYNEFVNLKI
jgi:hypothetical protein